MLGCMDELHIDLPEQVLSLGPRDLLTTAVLQWGTVDLHAALFFTGFALSQTMAIWAYSLRFMRSIYNAVFVVCEYAVRTRI